jgi:hypothetical protein
MKQVGRLRVDDCSSNAKFNRGGPCIGAMVHRNNRVNYRSHYGLVLRVMRRLYYKQREQHL